MMLKNYLFPLIIIFLLGCNSEAPKEDFLEENLEIETTENQLDSVYHYVRAHRYLEINNLSAAENRFKKVVELEPDFVSFNHIIRLLFILFTVPLILRLIDRK